MTLTVRKRMLEAELKDPPMSDAMARFEARVQARKRWSRPTPAMVSLMREYQRVVRQAQNKAETLIVRGIGSEKELLWFVKEFMPHLIIDTTPPQVDWKGLMPNGSVEGKVIARAAERAVLNPYTHLGQRRLAREFEELARDTANYLAQRNAPVVPRQAHAGPSRRRVSPPPAAPRKARPSHSYPKPFMMWNMPRRPQRSVSQALRDAEEWNRKQRGQ